ncbi:MAG: hypothetical protein JW909_10360 [Planctomycetes bacterium]|nr:hypothetical protein [Planctomycetota bacterium]
MNNADEKDLPRDELDGEPVDSQPVDCQPVNSPPTDAKDADSGRNVTSPHTEDDSMETEKTAPNTENSSPEAEKTAPEGADTADDSSISGRLEAMLHGMAEEHQWRRLEERVLETIEHVPPGAEAALASWLWWLMASTGIGVVVMGWLRAAEITGWKTSAIHGYLPVLGNTLLILSALGLIWAGRAAVSPKGEDSEFGPPALRWLIIGSGWAAALVGALVALLPAAQEGSVPGGTVPFIVFAAVSGLVASWALELRHQGIVLATAPDSALRRASVAIGILLILAASVLQVYFLALR